MHAGLTRAEAKAHGFARYWTGKACKRGHIVLRDVRTCVHALAARAFEIIIAPGTWRTGSRCVNNLAMQTPDPEVISSAEKHRERNRRYALTEAGREKQRARQKRYRDRIRTAEPIEDEGGLAG